MSEPLRYGIVGCGNIAGRHAESLRGEEAARVVAVYDPSQAKADEFARRHGARAFSGLPDLLASDVDIVLVATPSTTHARIALQAVRAGRHVVVEKPIDTVSEKAARLVREARASGVVLSVVSQHRFHDDVQWLRGVLESGALGGPVTATASSLWRRDQAYFDVPGRGRDDPAEGGVLLNQAVHVVDLVLWLLGPASSVSSHQATRVHRIAVEDTACATALLDSGVPVAIVASTSVSPQVGERLEIRCEWGSVTLQGGRVSSLEHEERLELPPVPSRRMDEGAADALEPFRRLHRDVCEAVRAQRDPLVTGEQAVDVVRFIEAAYRSHREEGRARPVRRGSLFRRVGGAAGEVRS